MRKSMSFKSLQKIRKKKRKKREEILSSEE
jgi:hypothetical protein